VSDDIAYTVIALLWLWTLWLVQIRPLVVNRRRPLCDPPTHGPWVKPNERWPQ
jgi:hypothetical protein